MCDKVVKKVKSESPSKPQNIFKDKITKLEKTNNESILEISKLQGDLQKIEVSKQSLSDLYKLCLDTGKSEMEQNSELKIEIQDLKHKILQQNSEKVIEITNEFQAYKIQQNNLQTIFLISFYLAVFVVTAIIITFKCFRLCFKKPKKNSIEMNNIEV